jgi:hypothetical protein
MFAAAREVFRRALGLEATVAEVGVSEAAELARIGLGPLASHYDLGADRAASKLIAASALRSKALHARSVVTARVIVEALKGVWFVVVKGPSVGVRFYPKPELRESVDLDILAAKKDHREIEGRLEKLGYSPDRSEAIGAEVTFIPGRADLMPVDFHFELWTSKPTLTAVLTHAEEIDAGVRIPVAAERMDVELLATHYMRDLGDRSSRLLDVLLARKKTGIEIAHEPTRRIVLRDAKRWYGIGEGAAQPSGPWRLIDDYFMSTDPLTRALRAISPRARVMRVLAAWLMRPSRGVERSLRALMPATASAGSWNESGPGWQLRRVSRFLKELLGGK